MQNIPNQCFEIQNDFLEEEMEEMLPLTESGISGGWVLDEEDIFIMEL